MITTRAPDGANKLKGQQNEHGQVWDEELARVSQRWADQCMPGHDQRRNVGSGYDDVADGDQCMPGHKELRFGSL